MIRSSISSGCRVPVGMPLLPPTPPTRLCRRPFFFLNVFSSSSSAGVPTAPEGAEEPRKRSSTARSPSEMPAPTTASKNLARAPELGSDAKSLAIVCHDGSPVTSVCTAIEGPPAPADLCSATLSASVHNPSSVCSISTRDASLMDSSMRLAASSCARASAPSQLFRCSRSSLASSSPLRRPRQARSIASLPGVSAPRSRPRISCSSSSVLSGLMLPALRRSSVSTCTLCSCGVWNHATTSSMRIFFTSSDAASCAATEPRRVLRSPPSTTEPRCCCFSLLRLTLPHLLDPGGLAESSPATTDPRCLGISAFTALILPRLTLRH